MCRGALGSYARCLVSGIELKVDDGPACIGLNHVVGSDRLLCKSCCPPGRSTQKNNRITVKAQRSRKENNWFHSHRQKRNAYKYLPLPERNSFALMHHQQWLAERNQYPSPHGHTAVTIFIFLSFAAFSHLFLFRSTALSLNLIFVTKVLFCPLPAGDETFLRLPFPSTPVFEVYFVNIFFLPSCMYLSCWCCLRFVNTHRNVANETRYVEELEFGNEKTAHKQTNRNVQGKYVEKSKAIH